MYCFDTRALEEDLKQGVVSHSDKLKYLLVISIFQVFGGWFNGPFALWNGIISLGIYIAGIIYCYTANKAGDNKDFLDRIICLAFPLIIRLSLVFLPFMLILGTGFTGTGRYDNNLINYIIIIVFKVYYFYKLRQYIVRISTASSIQPVSGSV